MTTTRYYIERETAIPGEWQRFNTQYKNIHDCVHDAEISVSTQKRRFRVVQITETIVGTYG